jgi:transposase
MLDATHVKAHRSAAGGKGGPRRRRSAAPAVGAPPRSTPPRSTPPRSTHAAKIHAAVDEHGRPRRLIVRLIVRPGHRGDAPVAAELIGDFAPALCLADAAYDSDAIRALLSARGGTPVIPNKPTRKRKHPFDRNAYRLRNVVEAHLLPPQGLAPHRDPLRQLARNFLSAVALTSIVSYWI